MATSRAQQPDPGLVADGGTVFQDTCAACHGTRAEGGIGARDDQRAGPPLDDVDVAYVDLTLRTGRMPIADRGVGVRQEELAPEEREAVVAWLSERIGAPGEVPEVADGDAGRGQELYVRSCAACHGAGGEGGVAGAGTTVPPVAGVDRVAAVEAIRVGPFQMPPFGEQALDDQEAADIATYLEEAEQAPTSLLGLHEVHEVSVALFAAGLALSSMAVLLVTARARRLSRQGSAAPGPAPPADGEAGA